MYLRLTRLYETYCQRPVSIWRLRDKLSRSVCDVCSYSAKVKRVGRDVWGCQRLTSNERCRNSSVGAIWLDRLRLDLGRRARISYATVSGGLTEETRFSMCMAVRAEIETDLRGQVVFLEAPCAFSTLLGFRQAVICF